MIEIDAKDSTSLINASNDELLKALKKLDWYFNYGPKRNRSEYLERISNLLLEIRARKILGEHVTARDLFFPDLENVNLVE